MQRCEWCGQMCRGLSPIQNRDPSLPGWFVWICAGCREAVQGEYWYRDFGAPMGLKISSKRPAARGRYPLGEAVESVVSEPGQLGRGLIDERGDQKCSDLCELGARETDADAVPLTSQEDLRQEDEDPETKNRVAIIVKWLKGLAKKARFLFDLG